MSMLNKRQIYLLDQLLGFTCYSPRTLHSLSVDGNVIDSLFQKVRIEENKEKIAVKEEFDPDEINLIFRIINHFLQPDEQSEYSSVTGGTTEELLEIKELFENNLHD